MYSPSKGLYIWDSFLLKRDIYSNYSEGNNSVYSWFSIMSLEEVFTYSKSNLTLYVFEKMAGLVGLKGVRLTGNLRYLI